MCIVRWVGCGFVMPAGFDWLGKYAFDKNAAGLRPENNRTDDSGASGT